jgi:colanic acid biosynthesis glycosyl transferase WcaI
MNITIISNNYAPEDSGIGLYSSDMAEFLAQKHTVKVITAFPYYPQWKIHDNYQNKGSYYNETINNVEVVRFKQFTPSKPKFSGRILQMLHFFFGSIVNVLKIKKSDVIIVVVPFTISIILGWFLKTIRGGKLIIHVQDFEFDAAFETGISSKTGFLSKIIFKIERMLFNRANAISTISFGMLKKLKTKTKVPTMYFPNWIDHSKINPETATSNSIFNDLKFNILYSGNIGAKQDWEFFIEFLESCMQIKDIHVYLIGDGAKKTAVVEQVQNFSNCTYLPPVKYEELNDLLCNASLHVLFQKSTVIDTVMPSKILGMMASSIPSIVTGYKESEVKNNFEESKGGFYFYEENSLEQIMEKIQELINNPSLYKETGKNARKFVIEKFYKENILTNFEKELAKI